jgi:beta-fructofuranosidase
MYKKPVIAGEYTHVYIPGADVFPGPAAMCFKAGEKYADWAPNDHAIIKGSDNKWHAFGITHPTPPDYKPPLEYNRETIHAGEWLLFHTVAGEGKFKDNIRNGAWRDLPKILYPSQRPGERNEIHAPFIVEKDGLYYMVYGPDPVRLAVSKDLYNWELKGALFTGHPTTRDPNILFHDGKYLLTNTVENYLLLRTSGDLVRWSEPVEIFRMNRKGDPESPVMVFYDNAFYLFWCIWDDDNGPYDNRTFVYRSEDPFNFKDAPLVAELKAHAPEVICDEYGNWYISSAEWPYRGISVAPLAWE